MRVQIAQEGVEAIPRQFLKVGALTWDDEPLPITPRWEWEPGQVLTVVGTGTDLRREEDGKITAEVDETLIPDGHSVTIYGQKVEGDIVGGVWVITSAHIRALFYTKKENVAW